MLFSFLIWKRDRELESRILEDLQKKYDVRASFLVEWSDQHWPKSLARLYARLVHQPPRNWRKLSEIGYSPFHLIVVSDPNPKIAPYNDRGILRFRNVNIFNSKHLYRRWAGTKYSIHSSIDDAETKWNLALILGKSYRKIIDDRWREGATEIVPFRTDTWGVSGWKTHADMFGLLGEATNYAVMRHRDPLPHPRAEPEGEDIDILVEDLGLAANALNPQRVKIKKDSIICYVKLGGGWNKIQLYDREKIAIGPRWSNDILSEAIQNSRGFKSANPCDDFYLFLQNGLSKGKVLRADYREEITNLYESATPDAHPPTDDKEFTLWSHQHLSEFIRNRGYDITALCAPAPVQTQPKRQTKQVILTEDSLNEVFSTPPLYNFRRPTFDSTIWKHDLPGFGSVAIKLVQIHAPDLATVVTREHEFLEKLRGRNFPDLIWGGMIGERYCLITKWIDAESLETTEDDVLRHIIENNGMEWLTRSLEEICNSLEQHKISHRDICKKNILISETKLYLIDFQWAIFTYQDNPRVKRKFQDRDDREDIAKIIENIRQLLI
jgi:predicted Ser/Thr protein kinase